MNMGFQKPVFILFGEVRFRHEISDHMDIALLAPIKLRHCSCCFFCIQGRTMLRPTTGCVFCAKQPISLFYAELFFCPQSTNLAATLERRYPDL